MEPHLIKNRGLTIVELLCVLAILGLLVGFIVSAVVLQRQRTQSVACLSNMRQLGNAIAQYVQDYDGVYPLASVASFNKDGEDMTESVRWCDVLLPYTHGSFLHCPSVQVDDDWVKQKLSCGYAYNPSLNEISVHSGITQYFGKGEPQVLEPSLMIAIAEARLGIVSLPQPEIPPYTDGNHVIYIRSLLAKSKKGIPGAIRHQGGANYVFLDGHTKWLRPTAFVPKCDGSKPCFKQ